MRTLRMIWAGLLGYLVDLILSNLAVGLAWSAAGIGTYNDLRWSNPVHIIVGLVLPVLMTIVGGGVAGFAAPLDAVHAGALVGGLGLLSMAVSPETFTPGSHTLALIIAQSVATVLAMFGARIGAHWRKQRT